MNAQSRRRIEMGARVLKFNGAHPDTDAGYAVTTARLEELLRQADVAAAAQRDGLTEVRAASARKESLRRTILAVPVAHLAEVGRAAAREDHELGTAFRFKPGNKSFQAFRVAARGMQLEAETRKEVLAKHGLSESVLVQFGRMLDEFDAAVALGIEGRTKHMGATAQLRLLAIEVGQGGAGDGCPQPAALRGGRAGAGLVALGECRAGHAARDDSDPGTRGRDAAGR